MIRHILNYLIILLLTAVAARAQDPVFSQFYSTPLMLNPAFAGTTFAPRIAATYRNQWPTASNVGITYSTYAASYEQAVPRMNSGFGLLVLSDNAGDGLLQMTNAMASYAYRIGVNDDLQIKLGVEAGFRQYQLDWDQLVFLDQIDQIEGPVLATNEIRPDALTNTIFDTGAGLLVFSSQYYGGVSLHHLTTPHEGFLNVNNGLIEGLPLRLSVHGGAQFIVKQGNKRQAASFISPNILFIKQGDQGQVNIGAYYSMGLVFAGGWYRHAFQNPDAAIAMVGVSYGVLKVGYSYDFTLSSLAPTGGSHEISLVINLENSERLRKKRFANRYNDCFKIFR
ncbi:MAG TPA: type IX secretion system membrane protein PorP/SprF [Bacteroidetes bacterium]|nr:type IX secretion system membrane protein PorP/SprF [Bacteroidota bacterium]